MSQIYKLYLDATRDESGINADFETYKEENKKTLKELYSSNEPFEIQVYNHINNFLFTELSKSVTLAFEDLKQDYSKFYQLVYLPYVNQTPTEENWIDFALQFYEKIFEAHLPTFYGEHGKLWAAYIYLDFSQIYFKFTAPKEVIKPYLGDIDYKTLNDFAMPYYYKEFANWSSKHAYDIEVKNWDDFTVSLD